MKTILTTVFFVLSTVLWTNKALSQSIDTGARKILADAYNKAANLDSLTYALMYSWGMGNEKYFSVRQIDLAYIHMYDKTRTIFHYIDDSSVKYVTVDSIFLYSSTADGWSVNVTTNSKEHRHGVYDIRNLSIYDMLYTDGQFADEWIDTIRFETRSVAANEKDSYVIDVIKKKREWNNGTSKSILLYDRYWINRASLLPTKRQAFAHKMDDLGSQQINIDEFTLSFPAKNPIHAFPLERFKDPKYRTNPLAAPAVKLEKDKKQQIALGSMAVDFSAKNLYSGKEEKLSDLKGKVVLLDFWYLSCAPCRALMPILQEISDKYKDKDFVLLGVNIADTDKTEISKYLQNKKYTYKQWYMSPNVRQLYNLSAFPTTLLIDKSGQIRCMETGFHDEIGTELSKLIEMELEK